MSPSRIVFAVLLCVAPAFGAFPTGWLRQAKLTVQHAQVPADQTAFPVLVTAATLPNEMVTAGGANAAQSDGGDIRFSSDAAGSSQLACEIVIWTQDANPALATAEIWVPVSILTASDVDIYVWYKAGGGVSQPAAGAAFGSQAVWDSNFKAVYHYANGSTLAATDSTSNANNGSIISGVTAVAGKIDGGASFSSGRISKSDNTSLRPSVITVSCWIKTTQSGNTVVLEKDGNNGFSVQLNSGGPLGIYMNVGGPNASLGVSTTYFTPDGNWHHVSFLYAVQALNSPLNHAMLDGVEHTNGSDPGTPGYSTGNFDIGSRNGSFPTAMQLDEVRLSNTTRTTTWITTEYNTSNSPTSFLVAGTPGPPPGAAGVPTRSLLGVGQ
jgi:hypothetical protein